MPHDVLLKILLVDDDKNIRRTLLVTLKTWGHEVTEATSAEEALRILKSERFDFILTDFKMEGKTGVDLIRGLKQVPFPPICAIMTAFASFENAVVAIREGAYDYLPKPFSNVQLEHLLKRVAVLVELKRDNLKLKSLHSRDDYFAGQTSPAVVRLEEFVTKVAPTSASILLVGESGTGKTELAKRIHSRSPRSSRPLAVVNCTTLAETLLESELFGHAKGAFTGASQEHMGKLEAANHGTVLIDEVGDLSLAGQTKLLRFLQEKVIERVGSNRVLELDVRVIAATNRNLEEAVAAGTFREDLYYRLNIFECALVPLRYRKQDLPVLIQRFQREFLSIDERLEGKVLPESVMKLLLDYTWPGNIRELRNVIERVQLLSLGRLAQPDDLPDGVREGALHKLPSTGSPDPLRSLQEVEREHVERVLDLEPSFEKAAQILGITTVTLWRKRKEYGLK